MASKSILKQFNSINELILTLDNAKTSEGWGSCQANIVMTPTNTATTHTKKHVI